MARGGDVSRKRDVNGKPIGHKNVNPILDSRRYKVEFYNGEVTELTTNVIADWMYDHCEENGNYMLLLDSFIDYQK